MEIIKKPIETLIPYAKNARVHDEAQIAQIAGSIKEFGFNNPVLIDKDNGIIAGHGRVMAARKLGLTEVPTILLDHLNETQRKAYILADNRIAINSTWDNEMLSLELMDIKDDVSLAMLGFNVDELNALLNPTELTEGLTDEDAVPDVPEEPKTKLGDIYQLGNHRLMCGDSTSIDAVEKLINNNKIDLCYTDPPYGINEKGDRSKRKGETSFSDGVKYKDFKDDSIEYAIDAYNIVEGVLKVPRQVWWGANYYCHSLPQSNNWFVWDKRVEDKQHDLNSDCELAWVKSKWSSVRIFRHLWKGLIKGSEHGQARVHPTQKPVALAEWSFEYFKEFNTVLDLFGGSGSTLMACEKRNKQAYIMELDPHYCDVIIKRWEDFTGKKAVLL